MGLWGIITVTPPSRLRFWTTSSRDGSWYGVGHNTAPYNCVFTHDLRVSWIKVWWTSFCCGPPCWWSLITCLESAVIPCGSPQSQEPSACCKVHAGSVWNYLTLCWSAENSLSWTLKVVSDSW
jgi:hypothetical protein